MATSAFSFHCMVCFEEFHPTERYPVVLPCGHTYVCNVCADRLDKCMECRTPLAWSVAKSLPPRPAAAHSRSPPSPPRRSSWASARSGGRISNPIPVSRPNSDLPQVEKKRLPLPKNVVLLSLLEATEIATQSTQRPPRQTPESSPGSPISEEPEFYDEEKIQAALSVAVGACGTYVVLAKEGIEIYPSRPNVSAEDEVEGMDEGVDSLVRFFHLDHKLDVNAEDNDLKPSLSKELPPLSCGDRVQIVSVNGGWAKLARGYGFVRAEKNELVKVAGSVDRACKLEAMLGALSLRRKELRKEQSKVDTHFVGLMKDLQSSLFNDEDLTVIPADTFEEAGRKALLASPQAQAEQEALDDASHSTAALEKPIPIHRVETPTFGNLSSPFAACFDPDSQPVLPSCLQRPASNLSPGTLSAGARAWRELHGRQASQTVDFRTGMSGHVGLASYHAHPHDYLKQDRPQGLLKMSSHSGLTVSRRRQTRSPNSLSIPSFSSSPTPPDRPAGGDGSA